MRKKKSGDFLDNRAFTFRVIDFNPKTQEYTLHNDHTREDIVVPKKRYFEMVEEAKKKNKPISV